MLVVELAGAVLVLVWVVALGSVEVLATEVDGLELVVVDGEVLPDDVEVVVVLDDEVLAVELVVVDGEVLPDDVELVVVDGVVLADAVELVVVDDGEGAADVGAVGEEVLVVDELAAADELCVEDATGAPVFCLGSL